MPGTMAISKFTNFPDEVPAVRSIDNSIGPSIAFGPFQLFPVQRLLMESNRPVHLGSRAFDILLALLKPPGVLRANEELIARVWPKTFVAPANLAVHISALRRALGDRPQGNRYIVNIPGRGYRFVAPVTVRGTPTPGSRMHEQKLPIDFTSPDERTEVFGWLSQQRQGVDNSPANSCFGSNHAVCDSEIDENCASCFYRQAFVGLDAGSFKGPNAKADLIVSE
jgi:DNA-binding winged helix-turn-helix (wHTH) protein